MCFRTEKEINKKLTETDGKEYNKSRENVSSENDKEGNNRGSNQVNEKNQKLNDTNIADIVKILRTKKPVNKNSITQQKPIKKSEMRKTAAKRIHMKELSK